MIHRWVDLTGVVSPPWTAFDGPGTTFGDPQVFVADSNDAPGTATRYTNFSGFTLADQCHNPVLSPDGSKVLFEVLSPSTNFREVWVVDAAPGSTPTQLVANGSQYCFHPAWFPDSDGFVYVLGSGGALSAGSVYKDTVSSPGSPTLLRSPTGGAGCFRPQVNYDGTRVAYLYTASGDPQLRCMDDDGTNDGLVDNTLAIYDSNEPPQFSWANTQNLIAFHDAQTPQNVFVIDDTGGGKTQINANGDAAGTSALVSGYGHAWPADDSFVVISGNIGTWQVFRAEVDGSDTTQLGTYSPGGLTYFRPALVYENRIWLIVGTPGGNTGIAYISLTGAEQAVVFDTGAGSGDQLYPFGGGDGWYFN